MQYVCVCVCVCAPVGKCRSEPREGPERTSRPQSKLDTPLAGPGSRRAPPLLELRFSRKAGCGGRSALVRRGPPNPSGVLP